VYYRAQPTAGALMIHGGIRYDEEEEEKEGAH